MEIWPLKETDQRITFSFRYWVWWLIALVFGAILFFTPPIDGGQIIFDLFIGLLTLIAVYASFHRQDLSLDLQTRRYKLRFGFVGRLNVLEGPIADLGAVSLIREWRSTGQNRSRIETWCIRLTVPRAKEAVDIGILHKEDEAYRRAEHYSRVLALPLNDATAEISGLPGAAKPVPFSPPSQAAIEEGTPRIGGAGAEGGDPGPPPHRSGIEVSGGPGERVVVLPPQGMSLPVVMAMVLGFAATSGSLILGLVIAPSLGSTSETDPDWIGVGIAALVMLIGLYFVFTAIKAASNRIRIEQTPSHLRIGKPLGSKDYHEVAYSEISRIDLVPQITRPEVLIKANRLIFHLGSNLDDAGRTWLLRWLRYSVGSGTQ